MANIDKELNDIKNAVYGREVRGSIHDGIKKINEESEESKQKADDAYEITQDLLDETFDSSLLEANFEQRLDNEIANLQPEWTGFKNDVTSQLAQKPNKGEVRSRAIPISLNDLDSEALAAIEGGELTSFNLLSIPRDYSVTPAKTTFAKKGKNLFDGTYVPDMIIAGSPINDDGSWEHRPGAISAVVNVDPGGTYTVSRSTDTNRLGIAASVGYPEESQYVRYIFQDFTGETPRYTLTLQEDEDHIIIYLSSGDEGLEPSWLQVEKGSVKTEYESPFAVKLELAEGSSVDGSVLINAAEKINFIDKNPDNLFDGVYHAWITSTGVPHISRPPSDGLKKSAIVEVEGGATYAINAICDIPSRFNVSTYDQNPLGSDSSLVALSFQSFTGQRSAVVTTPENATHMLVHIAEFDDVPKDLVITKTDKPQKPYILNTEMIEIEGVQLGRIFQKNIGYVTDYVSGNYAKLDTPTYVLSDITNGNPLENTYALWDELVSIAPEYVTKTHMWDEPVEGLPVYKYTFEPPRPLGPDAADFNSVKMLVIGNIHGHETYATLTLINFFSDLVRHWKSDGVLQMLRWNVQFDIFPAYNPYGLRHLSRVNGNGVDLNSNLAHNWSLRDEPGSMYYSGPEAMSEYENQQFELYLDNLSYSYDFALDMHHNGRYEGGHVTYTRSMNDDVNRILYGVANQMNGLLHKEYSEIFNDVQHGVMLADHLGTGRMFQFFEHKKIPGTILEIMYPDGPLSSNDAINIAQTSVGNIFLNVVRNINDIKIIR